MLAAPMFPVEVKVLVDAAKRGGTLSDRIDLISSALLGRPYVENPLGGGPDEKEKLTVSLHGFDCVTYLETVLGLAAARSPRDFISTIRRMRYRNGRVNWASRNHYMTGWARSNGWIVSDLTRGAYAIEKNRLLSVVPGIKPVNAKFRVFPKRAFAQVKKLIETGDIILFATTKTNLDVFHTGLLLKRDDEILIRHATRRAGLVIEQPLHSFLSEHRMSGFMLLRPAIIHR